MDQDVQETKNVSVIQYSYNDEDGKIGDCSEKTESILQEIEFIKNSIADKLIEREKLRDNRNSKLLVYNLMLEDTENKRLSEELQSKVKEEENLTNALKQYEGDLDSTNEKIKQLESQLEENNKKNQTQLAVRSNIAESIKSKMDEISVNETDKLNLQSQLNSEAEAKAQNLIALEKLQLDKRNFKIVFDNLEKEIFEMEKNHRQQCFKIINVPADEDISHMTVADVIKQAEKQMLTMEEECKIYEKELDREKPQLQGVRAECNLLTDKLAALNKQRLALHQQVERERQRAAIVTKEKDAWSDCSVESAIPIEVAIRRFKQSQILKH